MNLTLTELFAFPCKLVREGDRSRKLPMVKRWQDCESRADPSWPLVGVPTGARNGFDVLDIDPDGRGWFDQNFDALPLTQAHQTPRGGLHLLFRHCSGLRNSTSRIAKGVDVRAEGGFVVWWPRQGLPFKDHPISEWPSRLVCEAMTPRGEVVDTSNKSRMSVVGVGDGAASLAEALHKLDPVAYRGRRDPWLMLMNGYKFMGGACADFVSWSVGDPVYAGDGHEIAAQWDSLTPRHGGAFGAALKAAGIKVAKGQSHHDADTPHAALAGQSNSQSRSPSRVRSLRPWLDAIERSVARAQGNAREPALFAAACTMGEIIAEDRLNLAMATDLLEGYCRPNGLWLELGPEGCRRTIMNGLRHIELKLQQRSES